MKRTLVVGCGNRDRGDDGAGLLAVEAARAFLDDSVDAVQAGLDLLPLLDRWARYERIVLVDAVSTGSAAGTVHHWTEASLPPFAAVQACSCHGFGVGELIALARTLECGAPDVQVIGIEGAQFAPGAAVTPEVTAALGQAVREVVCTSMG